MLANVCGEADRAAELLTESSSWWEQTGEAYGRSLAGSILGGVYVSQGRYDEAKTLFTPNEAYFQDIGNDDLPAHARWHLGVIAWVQGMRPAPVACSGTPWSARIGPGCRPMPPIRCATSA
jgi:hypothetical protein